MRINIFIVLLLFFISTYSTTTMAIPHLILKTDFNGDGKADRVVFASYGISGFIQSTSANQKVDTIFLKQGNRSVYFTSNTADKIPYLKLVEEAGYFSVVTILKYQNRQFHHVTSYALPDRVYFSDDFFDDAQVVKQDAPMECRADEFKNNTISKTLSWAEMLKKHSLEETIKKSIDPSCQKVFPKDFEKIEKEVVEASKIESPKDKKDQNSLINCLDANAGTRELSGFYQQVLAANVFDSKFKITCDVSQKDTPKASFNSSSRLFTLYQTIPVDKDRSFKSDYFHEMLHLCGIKADDKVEALVQECIGNHKDQSKKNNRYYTNNMNEEVARKKDGVEVNVPPEVKTLPSTTVVAMSNEGSKALDGNFSMDNPAQLESLSRASRATLGSFEPLMQMAYQAAIPTALAQVNVNSGTAASGSTNATAIPTTRITASRGIASNSGITPSSGPTYDISSLPESVQASTSGQLGNGLSVKAAEVKVNNKNEPRSPASTSAGGEAGAGTSFAGLAGAGSLAYQPTTDRSDLRNSVPKLKAEDDFVKTLMTGKYADVKARLTDPANQKILEQKKIQYVAHDKTLGSLQPAIILKDLGNKFSVVRVTVE